MGYFNTLGQVTLRRNVHYSLNSFIIIFVVLESVKVHTKFQGTLPSGSSEEEIFNVLPHMDMAVILVM